MIYIFTLALASPFLTDILHVSSMIKYTIDFAWIMLMIITGLSKKKIEDPQLAKIMRVVLLFILLTIVGLVLEYQSVLYCLWGMRNNIRFFVFFMMCAMILKRDTADSCMRLLDKLFYINLAVTLYQVFVVKAHQDRVGGIFGASRGCNAYTNIYLMIIVAWHLFRYMNKEESIRKCLVTCFLSLLIAALAELKIFFFEFMIIAFCAMLMTRFSSRKIWIIVGSAVGVVVSIEILKRRFLFFADWFSLDRVLESAFNRGYTGGNDVNRLSSLIISGTRFLDTWPKKLLGLGLGNCDYSSRFEFLTTPFYKSYESLNYAWFSSSFLLLETGRLGLAVYSYFFIRVYEGVRTVERNERQSTVYSQMAKTMALMALPLIVYNGSLRMECAYMLFFVLAMPFMKKGEDG